MLNRGRDTVTDPSDIVVRLVRWPSEVELLETCRRSGEARLVMVEGEVSPPLSSDAREDWVRTSISRADLETRLATLRERVRAAAVPHLDRNCVLRYRGRYSSVSGMQARVLAELVSRFGAVVPRKTLNTTIFRATSNPPTRNVLDLHIMRLRRRIQPLGLSIRTVWGQGYMLHDSDAR